MKTHLLLIDMQNDFCCGGSKYNIGRNYEGSLYIPGADADAKKVAVFIDRMGYRIDEIHATLDSHHVVQVFHPIFWCNRDGKSPDPFTIISVEDVESGKWMTRHPAWRQRGLDYVKALKEKGNYPLTIWPYHCIIGQEGASVEYTVSSSLMKWEMTRFAMVNYCPKGDFYFSEAYGVFENEVPSPEEPSTMLNVSLINLLKKADEILIAGEALSHCVAASVFQLADNIGEENISKLVLLKDCCSNVPGFEYLGDKFVANMTARGMRVSNSLDYIQSR